MATPSPPPTRLTSKPVFSRPRYHTINLFPLGLPYLCWKRILLYIGLFRSLRTFPYLLFAFIPFVHSLSPNHLRPLPLNIAALLHPYRLRARRRAPSYDSVNFLHLGHRCPSSKSQWGSVASWMGSRLRLCFSLFPSPFA